MPSLEKTAQQYLTEAEEAGLLRCLKTTDRLDGVSVIRDGKRLISFSCNDYLGLSHHEKVIAAGVAALQKYGAGAGASRLITGNYPLYDELETKLAKIKGTESAIVFGSGYLANIGTIPALVGRGDLIIADKLVHACLLDGAVLSGAKLMRFAHNDLTKCESLLKANRKKYKNCLIITDHVFSMDGDIAPVDELYELALNYDAWLMTDDAHGLGLSLKGSFAGDFVVGSVLDSSRTPKYAADLRAVPPKNPLASDPFKESPAGILNRSVKKPHIQMGTLSKAAGCYGGYVCASAKIIEYLRNKTRSFVYSTGLPPSVTASAIAALDIIMEDKELCEKPLANAQYFTSLLGITEAQSPIVAVILGDEQKVLDLSFRLEHEGFLVSAIRPPTVPKGTARLRFTFSALHNREDIRKLAEIMRELAYDQNY